MFGHNRSASRAQEQSVGRRTAAHVRAQSRRPPCVQHRTAHALHRLSAPLSQQFLGPWLCPLFLSMALYGFRMNTSKGARRKAPAPWGLGPASFGAQPSRKAPEQPSVGRGRPRRGPTTGLGPCANPSLPPTGWMGGESERQRHPIPCRPRGSHGFLL